MVIAALLPAAGLAAGEAKNVIFFLGDGMGPVTVTAARILKYKEEGSLNMDKLPRTARIKTFSLDAQTTDSAPSMAAYMTGVKTRNETLSLDATTKAFSPGRDAATNVANSVNNCPATGNGVASATLLELAIAKGKATGVVSTARLTHATPAATYAHVCHRNAEYEIARQAAPGGAGYNTALGAGVDVLMGGISQYWTPFNATSNKQGRPDGRDLVVEMKAKGYSFVTDLLSLNAAPVAAGTKMLGLYDFAVSQGHMSYNLDRDASKEPSLAQMTVKSLEILSKNTNGFFLMVEGGRIDHALHETNAARALDETIAFDDAIKAAIDKVKTFDPTLANTLIVVTADHDHTMAFNGYGKRGDSPLGLSNSFIDGTPNKDKNGVPYTTLVFGGGSNRPDTRSVLTTPGVTDINYLQEVAVRRGGKGSETHGGGDVIMMSAGAGSTNFKGTLDNTKVFGLVKAAAGY